jgi:PTH1 family peptidyl-tRNA hydrolase
LANPDRHVRVAIETGLTVKLIVGLGNPGKKYEGTRHNVGFEVISELARRYDVGRPKAKFNAEIAETTIKNEKTVLMCPLTYMNLSGQSVRAAYDFYKLSLDEILIVCDDVNLPLARLRLRPSGSAGGQNGLTDIIERLGSQQFSRLRIGIDRPPPGWEVSNYVLGRFSTEDRVAIEPAVKWAGDAIECWIGEGIGKAMSRFNPDPEEIKRRAQQKLEAAAKRSKAKSDAEARRSTEFAENNNQPEIEE